MNHNEIREEEVEKFENRLRAKAPEFPHIWQMVQRMAVNKEIKEECDYLRASLTLSYNAGIEKSVEVDENTSDGCHTFKELYEFRKLYNAGFFNALGDVVHKSKKHSDGELCFGGGWFIVTANLPTGQISNHYELKDWHLFHCEEREMAEKWDGHTSQDVVKRLTDFIISTN